MSISWIFCACLEGLAPDGRDDIDIDLAVQRGNSLKILLSGAIAVEALSHKVAVIASDIGRLASSVRHRETGLLVGPDSPNALASAIEELAHNRELLSSLAKRGHSLISSQFTAEKHFEVFSSLISNALRNHGSRAGHSNAHVGELPGSERER